MKHLVKNLRLAARTAGEHLTDDPALLLLQLSQRLPFGVLNRLAGLVRSVATLDSVAVPVLLAGLVVGEKQDVIRRLEGALSGSNLSAEQARSLADVALVADRPDLADFFLARAKGSRRFRAVQARRLWYAGALSAAVEVLDEAGCRAERRQGRRLAADLRILEGWHPELPQVRFESVPQRVLHVLTNSLPHTASGYAQRSHSILLAQQEAGWETLAVTRVGYPVQVGKLAAQNLDVVDGIPYQRLLPSRLAETMQGRLQQQAEELLAVAVKFRPSVLHTTTHYVNALVVRAVAQAVGIPWVYEVRGQLADTWAASRGADATGSERYSLFKQREAEVMQDADLIVTLGDTMKTNIVSTGISTCKVIIAPNAVGGDFLAEPVDAATARLELGLDESGPYIGTVSSLVAYEGLDCLIAAFMVLAPRFPGLKLLIVGDGVARSALEVQARRSGYGDRIIFTGRVTREQAVRYHQALDIFVVPRKDLEVTQSVTPLKPVEALACARPVVASRLPALEEIVLDGLNGTLFQAENTSELAGALGVLLADEPLRSRMGRTGRMQVLESRTWAANARVLITAYREL